MTRGRHVRDFVSFAPLAAEVDRRRRLRRATLRDVLAPDADGREWARVRRAWHRGRTTGRITTDALDDLCGRLGIHPSELRW